MKDRIQKEGINKWYQAGCNGTLEYATGVGKSRCGVLAAGWLVKSKPDASILILTSTQTIRDQAWIAEFKKWGAYHIFEDNVECVCIQTAYKYEGRHYNLIIADEVHNYLGFEEGSKYFRVFENNTYDKLLCLSASIDVDLLPKLNTIAPICDSIDTNKAVELGLVSPFQIYNVMVNLSEDERAAYHKCDVEFNKTFSVFKHDLTVMFECLKSHTYFTKHLMNVFGGYTLSPAEKSEIMHKYKSYPNRCSNAMKERKSILYEANEKLDAIEHISNLINTRKGVIFSQTSKFADRVGEVLGDICVVEHSKIRPPKKRLENIKKFQDDRTRVRRISAVKSLNEGANLKGTSFIIIASGTSKLKDTIQRIGRSVRFEDGKTALIIRLCVRDSQEEKWMKSSQTGYDVNVVSEYKKLEEYVKHRNEELSRIDD